jgi:hypothetical protein
MKLRTVLTILAAAQLAAAGVHADAAKALQKLERQGLELTSDAFLTHWQPDAELVDLGTTTQGLLEADGRSAH